MAQEGNKPLEPVNTGTPRERALGLVANAREWLGKLMDLTEGMDREGTIIAIKNGRKMQGANAWMLMCSIMIASLGLDLNSPAVIIGAMLISPLMSPILGVGLGVAINDREALTLSLRHFGIAILIALTTSFLYFAFSPLNYGLITEEIQARTAPTILDGLVAIFGGLAGIISTTRKDKTNAIPGVAIATALMPPLCVTGYGLVYGLKTNNWDIAYNSFYLFFLNSFIIALTTYFIIRLLGFPYRSYPDEREAKRAQMIIFVFTLVILIPGIFSLVTVAKQLSYQKRISDYITTHFDRRCSEYEVYEVAEDSSLLIMELINTTVTDSAVAVYDSLLHAPPYNLPRTLHVKPFSDFDVQLDRLDRMQYQLKSLDAVSEQIEKLNQQQQQQAKLNEKLSQELTLLQSDSLAFDKLRLQIGAVFPQVATLSYGTVRRAALDTTARQIPLVVVEWKNGRRDRAFRQQQAQLDSFLRVSLEVDSLQIVTVRDSR